MNIAQRVKEKIQKACPDTFSLYAGYGLVGGRYVRFPQGVQLSESRNKSGRVVSALYQYADDSKLKYTYNTRSGSYTLEHNLSNH